MVSGYSLLQRSINFVKIEFSPR